MGRPMYNRNVNSITVCSAKWGLIQRMRGAFASLSYLLKMYAIKAFQKARLVIDFRRK